MTTKRQSVAAQFRVRVYRRGFCQESINWVKGRSLVQAWRDCPNGSWMAWWLMQYTPAVTEQDINNLFYARLGLGSFDWDYTVIGDAEQQRQMADVLRSVYTATGRKRR